MARKVFLRNVRARDQLDVFLVSAVSSLLLVRFYLHLAGYPQLGGGDFHIAHMLYGGILMMLALVNAIAFLGARALRISAVLGGIGFGVFIDELGKFITKDNNYFFHPTIGIIYAIFICLYLGFNFLSREQKLSSREYQLNALSQLEEAIIRDMDRYEKRRVAGLLQEANQNSQFTKVLWHFLNEVETVPAGGPHRIKVFFRRIEKSYRRFWRSRNSNIVVQLLFVLQAVIFLLAVIATIYHNFDQVRELLEGNKEIYSSQLLIGQLVASGIAAGFAIAGAALLPKSRVTAFEQFRRATLINLYLTEFFIFSRIQFQALPGFLFNLLLLGLISYALYQEKHDNDKVLEGEAIWKTK
ncbi:MAG TPA: hypothetical protein VFL85_03500 [Candidatus Saccharimonadales bacterium]|nr:hypothetical protein [Candidatus Saccharimonadales bacterium]